MRGRIYSDQKCPVCHSSFIHDERRRGLYCPNHPDQEATRYFTVRFGRKVNKRFPSYIHAERFLDGLRYEVDQGKFDPREYQASNPLGFKNLSETWLKSKADQIRPGTHRLYTNYLHKAQETWGNRSIKTIQYAELEDFLYSLYLSNKTRANVRACLHHFWQWLVKRRIIKHDEFPEFPAISFELGWRNTIDKDTQDQIIEEVYRISNHVNIKIWLGVKWLSTYISLRPTELLNLREENIDLKNGFLIIPHPKEKQPKIIPLIAEDLEILHTIPPGLPHLRFFRHRSGVSGVRPGEPFGKKSLYKWWKKACSNLGIENVDMYGGTRHSSALALTEHFSPEQIRRGTMHSTNKAFERYYRVTKNEVKNLYEATRSQTSHPAIRNKKHP